MREALGEVQARIVAEDTAGDGEDDNNRGGGNAGGGAAAAPRLTVKGNAHIRITHLPPR